MRSTTLPAGVSWTPADPAVLSQPMRIVMRVQKGSAINTVSVWVNGSLVISRNDAVTSAIDLFRLIKFVHSSSLVGNQGKQIFRDFKLFPNGLTGAEALQESVL